MYMKGLEVIKITAPGRITADGNGAAVDVGRLHGKALLVIQASATEESDDTFTGKLQTSADGSTNWTDVAGASATSVTNAAASHQTKEIDADGLAQYVRWVDDVGGTTPAVTRAVVIVGHRERV